MITIDYNNAKLVDVLGCNGETFFCWVDNESGDVLREFDETDLEITSEYVEFWDAGRETVVGAWVDSTGKIAEIVDETTREAEGELALEDDFLFDF
jgi:hypothetical protein